LLALLIGLLVTVPVTYLSVYVLFEDLTSDAVAEVEESA